MTQDRPAPDTTLVLDRRFAAMPERVWRAWAEPERLAKWCFPKDFTVPEATSDIREGGTYRTCLKAPDGTEHWVQGTYTDLTPFERIVFTHAWADADGATALETVVTLTFRPDGDGTLLRLTQTGLASVASRDGHAEGWIETLDNLDAYLG